MRPLHLHVHMHLHLHPHLHVSCTGGRTDGSRILCWEAVTISKITQMLGECLTQLCSESSENTQILAPGEGARQTLAAQNCWTVTARFGLPRACSARKPMPKVALHSPGNAARGSRVRQRGSDAHWWQVRAIIRRHSHVSCSLGSGWGGGYRGQSAERSPSP
eukprot:gene11193-biopygen13909